MIPSVQTPDWVLLPQDLNVARMLAYWLPSTRSYGGPFARVICGRVWLGLRFDKFQKSALILSRMVSAHALRRTVVLYRAAFPWQHQIRPSRQ
jgi:hypothetical protein